MIPDVLEHPTSPSFVKFLISSGKRERLNGKSKDSRLLDTGNFLNFDVNDVKKGKTKTIILSLIEYFNFYVHKSIKLPFAKRNE